MAAGPQRGNATGSDYEPNFELPRHGVIREDNWLEYEARGFRPVIEPLKSAQLTYGIEHVYTGEPYDYREGRPLRHQPGEGVYVSPEGQQIGAQKSREWQEWLAQRAERQDPSEGGPDSN
jgi:hypothetical protein